MLKRFSFIFILLIGLTAGQTKQEINDHEDDSSFTIDNPMNARPSWPSVTRTTIRGKRFKEVTNFVSLESALSNKLSCAPDTLKDALKKAQSELGSLSIVSGYRSPEYNRRVGGARYSYHTRCQAADVRVVGVSPNRVAKYFASIDDIGGIGTYSNHSFVHIDIGPKRAWHYGGRNR